MREIYDIMLKYFNNSTRLADAITLYPSLIRLLPRFNILLGFGNKSMEEVCREFGVPKDLFITVCNIYAFDCFRPTSDDMKTIDVSNLITYLKCSHIHYFENRIPHIEKHLKRVIEQADGNHGTILMNFFLQYKKEVRKHFDYEENVVFPILSNQKELSIDEVELNGYCESHTNIEDTLDDLIQIVFKYMPGNMAHDNIINMAFDILQLAEDLRRHAMVEELILIPFIENHERRDW